jgi:hypothetical protein
MIDRLLSRAREGRKALATYKTPLWEGLAVALFIAAMPLAIVLS